MLTRRQFVASSASATAAAALLAASPASFAIDPLKRDGKQMLKLSLAAYSLRGFFRKGELDMPGFIDYCSSLGLHGTELTSYFFPEEVKPAFLNDLKRRAHIAGIEISGGAIGNNFTLQPGPKLDEQIAHTKTWIDHYAAMGAPVIRVFAGRPEKGVDDATAIKRSVPVFEQVCEYAGSKGVILAIENHDFTTRIAPMMEIIKAVKSPWFGVNLDSGNFHSADPYADLEKIVPYAVNAQIKVDIRREGKPKEPAELGRVVKILRDGGYSGYVVLEYEASDDPYKAIPRYLDELRKHIG